jgi:cobalt-precorrin-7 (C5)-methyltransferase
VQKIAVLAVGPGSPDHLTPAVSMQAAACDLLVGGRRNLALFDFPGQEKIEITGKIAPVIEQVKEKMADRKIGILVSGDTGIYSILPRLVSEFGREALDVYPGISAVQYMFARLGLTWEKADFISLHGRQCADLPAALNSPLPVVFFTDRRNTPALVCRKLVDAGLAAKKVYLGEDLSYAHEKISEGRPEDFLNYAASELNLVVIVNE